MRILLFLPIAFIRTWLKQINWPDSYIEFTSKDKTAERKYSESKTYQAILQVTLNYFNNPDADTIIKIAGRSAEFKAINQLLLDQPDYNINDVKISSTVIPSIDETESY